MCHELLFSQGIKETKTRLNFRISRADHGKGLPSKRSEDPLARLFYFSYNNHYHNNGHFNDGRHNDTRSHWYLSKRL